MSTSGSVWMGRAEGQADTPLIGESDVGLKPPGPRDCDHI